MILYVSCPDATPSGLSIMPKQSGPHPLQRPVDRLYARHLCMLCVKYENRTCKLNCKSISTKNKDLPTQTEIISTIYEKKLPFQSLSMALSFLLPLQYASSRVSSQTRKPWGSGFEWSDMKSWESGSEWSDMLRPLDRWGVGSVRFTVSVSDGSSGAENGVFFSPVQTTTEAGIPTHWLWGNMLLLQIFQDSGSYASQERSFKSADNQQVTPVR